MVNWIFDDQEITSLEGFEGFKAFVYCITNLTTGMQYFGKKRLNFVRHKKRKGRRNRIKVTSESDWKEYWGSSEKLLQDKERIGESSFSRRILRFCRSLSESSYYELKYQMEYDVLLHPELFYNSYVGARISRNQLGIK